VVAIAAHPRARLAGRSAGPVTLARHEGAIMTFPDESAWRGKVHQGCRTRGAGGDAFTVTRWVTMRGDIARYPF
jgi:hypothetical protein